MISAAAQNLFTHILFFKFTNAKLNDFDNKTSKTMLPEHRVLF